MNKKHLAGYTATALIALGVGGASASGEPKTVTVTKNVPGPAVTQTINVPGPVETVNVPGPTVTKTVTKVTYKVSASCLKALDEADADIAITAQVFGDSADVIQGVLDNNLALIGASTSHMQSLDPKLAAIAPRYIAARAACKAGE
jgi:hypothetical protein